MTPDRWREITEILHASLARDLAERDAFLAARCGHDVGLRREVESMLAAHDEAGSFGETPVVTPGRELDAHASIDGGPLTAGNRVGPFEIVSVLGRGGMGQVYRARDTKLHREVALKVLRPEFADDPDRIGRFAREARVLASLNHPHIAQVYGLEEANGVRALVMELVEGPTLADRIARGAIPISEALPIGRQIAEALEAAHEHGVIHRDLKPANIKVRPDGAVKVLDFGLAKTTTAAAPGDSSHAPTITGEQRTVPGVVLGTASYMSPEQARGSIVDRRADLWAFGVVFYEMLTGARPFDGATMTATIAAVLSRSPDWAALPANTPAPIRRLLRRCLEKDREGRLDSAAAARLDIDDALTAHTSDDSGQLSSPRRTSIVTAAAAIALAAAAIASIATWLLARADPVAPAPLTRFSIDVPTALPLAMQGTDRDFALAPDGSFLVYRAGAQAQLAVRRFDRLDASPIAGVTGARGPFVSPDGRWVGYVENNTTLKKIAIGGGVPVTLATLPGSPRGATWLEDGSIIVATNATGLQRVPASGGEPMTLTTPDRERDELGHLHPSALPGGRAVLFTIRASRPENTQVALLDLDTNRITALLRGGDAHYTAPGHLAFAAGGALSVAPFDLSRRTVTGDSIALVDGVAVTDSGALSAATTRNGTLVYLPADARREALRSLLWVDRQGRETPIEAPPDAYLSPRLSPDGARVALEIRNQGTTNIWVWDLGRQTLARLTFSGALAPVWTPDGQRVVFASSGEVAPNLHAHAADGLGDDVRLTASALVQVPSSVTLDGVSIIGVERRPQTGADVVRVTLRADGAAPSPVEGLVETPFTEQNGEVSPDGRYLAYESNESGRFEIYVRPYPHVANGRWQVSTSGGTRPAWTRKGRELVYLNGANQLTSAAVETDARTFRVSTPALISTTPYATTVAWRTYDVSSNGERFLVLKEGPGGSQPLPPPRFVVLQNWLEELKAKGR